MAASEFTFKRGLAYLSWQRKRKHRFSASVLRSMLHDIEQHALDHVLVTGDQCNLSLDAEFSHVVAWLEAMGSPEHVSVIPGNHDAHLARPQKTWNAHWQAYMQGDDGSTQFPYLRRRGNVAIIGVSSAIPTALFFANGRVGAQQLARLRTLLLRCQQEGLFRVVMIHHPPQIGAMQWRKCLSDAHAFRAVLKETGAELVLHGHGHEAVRATLEGPQGLIAVRGAASASANGNHMPCAHYHVLQVQRETQHWALRIVHRRYDPATMLFATVDEEQLTLPAPQDLKAGV
jgi:3',5'-cyclic AMP phosphodiesterase CpdA